MRGIRRIAAYAAPLALSAGLLGGCGGSADTVVARVGDTTIGSGMLDHWTEVIRGGAGTSDPAGGRRRAVREQALGQLIVWHWLIDEARARGLGASPAEVRRQIDAKEQRSFPGGEGELRDYLQPTGQTVADVTLEAEAELARSRLRGQVLARVPAVGAAAVVRYYAQHRQRFFVPEWREALITNRKSPAAARRMRHELEAGRSRASFWREALSAPVAWESRHVEEGVSRAILLTRLGAFGGPVRQRIDWFAFEVVKIVPAHYRALAQVRDAIHGQLEGEARQRAVTAFAREWSARWSARTSCRPADVVPGCREDPGTAPAAPFGTS